MTAQTQNADTYFLPSKPREAFNRAGLTPLYAAVANGDAAAFHDLKNSARDRDDDKLWEVAGAFGRVEMLEVFKHDLKNIRRSYVTAAFDAACRNGHADVTAWLRTQLTGMVNAEEMAKGCIQAVRGGHRHIVAPMVKTISQAPLKLEKREWLLCDIAESAAFHGDKETLRDIHDVQPGALPRKALQIAQKALGGGHHGLLAEVLSRCSGEIGQEGRDQLFLAAVGKKMMDEAQWLLEKGAVIGAFDNSAIKNVMTFDGEDRPVWLRFLFAHGADESFALSLFDDIEPLSVAEAGRAEIRQAAAPLHDERFAKIDGVYGPHRAAGWTMCGGDGMNGLDHAAQGYVLARVIAAHPDVRNVLAESTGARKALEVACANGHIAEVLDPALWRGAAKQGLAVFGRLDADTKEKLSQRGVLNRLGALVLNEGIDGTVKKTGRYKL